MENGIRPKAALYVRVSTEEQALEGQSANAQAEILKQYCSTYNIDLFNVYEDLGISGKSIRNRPGLSQLIEDGRNKCFNIVLVWKISRLSRNLKELLHVIDILEKSGISFSSYSEKFDTSTPVGRMTLQLLGSIAEFERNTIIENVKLGLMEFGRKGGKTCTVLGYDNVDKKLVVNEQEAASVKLIFDLYTSTAMSFSSIACHLNKLGYKTKRDYSFKGPCISEIISNPVYIGLNRHNVGKTNEYTVQGSHEPLISREIWNKSQYRKDYEKKRRRKASSDASLLSGLVTCNNCSSTMNIFYTYSADKVYRYYRCCKSSRCTSSCSNYINAAKLDSRVLGFLESVLSCGIITEDIDMLISRRFHASQLVKASDTKLLDDEIKRLYKSKSRYMKLFEDYKISEENTFIERIKELECRIKILEEKKAESAGSYTGTELPRTGELYRKAFKDFLCSPGLTDLKTLIPYIIKSIKVSGKQADMETYFPVK